MNACDRFADRLWDEDARRALVRGAAPPEDMRAHASECRACRKVWDSSVVEMGTLAAGLAEPAPARLRSRALCAMHEALPGRPAPLIDWKPAALWALSGAAVGVSALALSGGLSLPLAWQGLVVSLVALGCLSAVVTRQGLEASGA